MPFRSQQVYAFNSNWKEVGAVYGVLDANKNVVYVGKTDNLKRRHGEHCADVRHLMHRHGPMYMLVEIIESEQERIVRERQLIMEYNPPCNQR